MHIANPYEEMCICVNIGTEKIGAPNRESGVFPGSGRVGTTNWQNSEQTCAPFHLGALNTEEHLDPSLRIVAVLALVMRTD